MNSKIYILIYLSLSDILIYYLLILDKMTLGLDVYLLITPWNIVTYID